MLKNYLKVALRNLWKNKTYSAINIVGLSVGLATCLLIMLFVNDELAYDRYNKNADRIFRIDGDIRFGGTHFILAVAPPLMSGVLVKDYPEIMSSVRFRDYGGLLVKKGNENIQENRVIYTESSIFDIFSLQVIAGDPKNSLTAPHTVVITKSTAEKYFNRTDVVGETLVVNDTGNYKVTAVIADLPAQSHFRFDLFVSLSESEESKRQDWLSNNFVTYILVKPGTDVKALETKLQGLVNQYIYPQAQQVLNVDKEAFEKSGNYVKYSLMPLTQIHLHSNKVAELGANGNIEFIYIFSAIALFILLIACVNFMNLSTARSSNRAKEVGVRKVVGSLRKHLILQFLSESVVISFFALLLSLLLVIIALPLFNQFTGKETFFSALSYSWMLPVLLLLVPVVGLIAGSYPAFFLSAFQPIEVLKGKLSAGFKSSWLRSSLMVFQFAISIMLIVGTAVIYYQLNYIRNKDLGYSREQVMVIQNCYPLHNQAKIFEEELKKLPGVKGTTMTGYLPTSSYRNDSPLFEDATLSQDKAVSMQNWYVDENYIPTLGMQLAKGRNFSKDFATDSDAIILNEAAAKLLSFKDPVDQQLYYLKSFTPREIKIYHVIGVMKDFNFNSLREQVTPLVLFYREEHGSIALRVSTDDLPGLISQIRDKWKAMAPGQPFAYSFMDDDFNNTYQSEQRIGKIFIAFAVLAILIACLGLFGLVTYAAEQRTKEIGIRKVLGATVANIVSMLSKDFLRLVFIASLIAFPVASFAMNRWLQDFAYRINISWWIFGMAAMTALLIALVTVGLQATKAALANPVKSLRTE